MYFSSSRSQNIVPKTGLEPARLATHAPETCASTNSATWALLLVVPSFRAENGTRTRDPNLGKVVLYQLSYFRIHQNLIINKEHFAKCFSFSDSDRIQTCNLLIRSQMLYSVELRSRAVSLSFATNSFVTPTGFKPVTF